MPETKRYNVGPDQGYKTKTVLKLTAAEAKAMGLSDADVSDVTTTADDVTKRDRYEEAMTSQDRMREQEVATATAATEDASSKKRSAPKT